MASTVDPLAGSYYVESLTNAIEAGARSYLRRIDDMGGTLEAINRGFFQQEIQDAAYSWQREVNFGERIIVGVNRFQMDEPPHSDIMRIRPRVASRPDWTPAQVEAIAGRSGLGRQPRKTSQCGGHEREPDTVHNRVC